MKNVEKIMYLLGKQQALSKLEVSSSNIIKKRMSIRWVAVLAATLAILIGLTAVIYAAVKGNFQPESFEDSVGYGSHIDTNKGALDTSENNNLKVTVTNAHLGGRVLYITFNVESLDKSPLHVATDTEVSVLSSQGFEKASIKYDGSEYYSDLMFRLDNGSIPYKATFEAAFMDKSGRTIPKELLDHVLNVNVVSGKKVEFVLKDYYDKVEKSQSLGFKYDSLSDVYRELPGKVYFSEKYPHAYIDSIEFKPDPETQKDMCYIRIVPGSAGAKKELVEKLAVQNIVTGSVFTGDPIIDDGDSLVLSFRSEKGNDVTADDLEKYILKLYTGFETRIIKKGTWTTEFRLNDVSEPLTFEGEKSVVLASGEEITVTNVILSSTNIEYKFIRSFYDKEYITCKIVYKDGTEIEIGDKVAGTAYPDGFCEMESFIKTVVDLNQVLGVKFGDTIIELD